MGESGSEVYHFITEFRNFSEVTKLSDEFKKNLLKKTKKEIRNIINNQNFRVKELKKGDLVNPCTDVYKAKIYSDGSLDKLKLRILVRGDLKKK